MRVPVLVVLPSQDPLQESAAAYRGRRASSLPLSSATVPDEVELDPDFTAIPLGSGVPGTSMDSLAPGTSKMFAIRGYLEAERVEDVPAESGGSKLFSDPLIEPFLTCGSSPPVGTTATVRQKLRSSALQEKGLDGEGVAIAIMDTGINLTHLLQKLKTAPRFDAVNSWTPSGISTAPGKHPVAHGTMCAFDALIMAPKATLLDFPVLATSAPGGAMTGRSLSGALLAFSQLMADWSVAFAPSGTSKYEALVINNSWGMYHPSWDFPPGHPGRYLDNPQHPFNVIVGTLTRSGADVLFAAGNCGAQCPDGRCKGEVTGTITGANALGEVLTLAGCDTTDRRVGYSSQGPSIQGMSQLKPDLTSYTHFLGSEYHGKGSPDMGTSAACPVAAGCVAALRTRLPPTTLPPSGLFAQFHATARSVEGQNGWNGDYGHGIIDPLAAAESLGL